MKYRVRPRKNPRDEDAPIKFYAAPVSSGRVSLMELADRIARSSSLTRGDIENVLSNFLDELPEYLKDGKSVQLGEFATVRLSFSSEGVDSADEVNASLIRGTRVIFTPSTNLKKELSLTHFERED